MASTDVCECEHPRSQHKRQRDGCRALDCGCAKFSADLRATAAAEGVDLTRVLTTFAEVCEDQAAKARAELVALDPDLAHAEDLRAGIDSPFGRRVSATERERDELAARLHAAHDALTRLVDADDDAFTTLESTVEYVVTSYRSTSTGYDELAAAFDESDVARLKAEAELALLRSELESWRGQSSTQQAEIRRLGALLGDRGAELEQARAVPPLHGAGLYEHVHCTDMPTLIGDPYPEPGCGKHTGNASNRCLLAADHTGQCDDNPPIAYCAAVLYAYDAWSCLVDGGCAARYTVPYPDHPCGRLTPTRVTITHRTEGAPSA